MTENRLPLLIEPAELQKALNKKRILVVDLCKSESYTHGHIPGAVHLEYSRLVAASPPVMGLVPEPDQLSKVLSDIGLSPGIHVIAYDDEGGGKAARFLYTLDLIGHKQYSLLNGGIKAWSNEGFVMADLPVNPKTSEYKVEINDSPVADKDFILEHLIDPAIVLIDARSTKEYSGEEKRAEHSGHIPGAVNIDWMQLMDKNNNYRLKPAEQLQNIFLDKNITIDKTVVTYCQTHHRSALTYFALKYLGYDKVKGYPGSWSDWGNDPDMPADLA